MGSEIESKIILTEEEFDRIVAEFGKRDTYEVANKSDKYYSVYGSIEQGRAHKEPLIRIREEGDKAFFTLKKKTVRDGVEYNEENETFVEDSSVIEKFLLATGYKKVFEKTKETMGVYYNDSEFSYHAEVEKLNDKVFAIEVECVEPGDPQKIKEGVLKVFEAIGIKDPGSRLESRSWMEILRD